MGILVTYPLSPQLVQSGLGNPILYRPDLVSQRDDALRRTLTELCPSTLMVHGNRPTPETLDAWRRRTERPVRLICHGEQKGDLSRVPGVEVEHVDGSPSYLPDDIRALGMAERYLVRRRVAERLSAVGVGPWPTEFLAGASVILVGAGIVNLMTALELMQQGAEVTVLDGNSDPRRESDWRRLGTTHGGENARMFCFTEADNYNDKSHGAYLGMNQVFRRTITDGGWMAIDPSNLDAQEQAWIEAFYSLPRWRAEVFTEDIHEFSIASHPIWQRLQKDAAHLFEDVGTTQGVLRLYASEEKVASAAALHGRIGSLLEVLDADALSRTHPACRDAVEKGEIAGALEVRGFTVNIHRQVAKLLSHLEAGGVTFQWRHRVQSIERGDDGIVRGLRVQDLARGETQTMRSRHYVVSPGVYGHGLLEGTRAAGRIQGILGLWLLLPNVTPQLMRSIKIHREGHVGEDSNVTVAWDASGRPIMVLGSGYGFLGNRPLDMDSPHLARLFEALEWTAERFFPKAYEQAKQGSRFFDARRACVRPFTSNGLGVFDVLGTSEGGRLVIASGHNTGGFAQAPAVAESVATTLAGAVDNMQSLYAPDRETLLRPWDAELLEANTAEANA